MIQYLSGIVYICVLVRNSASHTGHCRARAPPRVPTMGHGVDSEASGWVTDYMLCACLLSFAGSLYVRKASMHAVRTQIAYMCKYQSDDLRALTQSIRGNHHR